MNPNALEKYRKKEKLSVTKLSEMMGKTPGWYSRIKNGKQGLPMKYIAPMAVVFGVKPDKLAKEYFSDQ